ncbi:uncharacterized protein LOC135709611 [Ochlerotatus camptorhynchus]|uniref:uncharacterized protein LOC135709611 n=1 Tax=Ochlerotatus camptorhynchus TaxID=644619 RepID=UPI0031D5C21A
MAKGDELHGFPDDGFDRKIEQNNPRYLATEAVTVMVRRVFTKFKQDCLESLFSEIRRRCGSNDTPDSLQFEAAFKYACIEAGSCPREGKHCEKDDSEPLLSTTELDTGKHITNANPKANLLSPPTTTTHRRFLPAVADA